MSSTALRLWLVKRPAERGSDPFGGSADTEADRARLRGQLALRMADRSSHQLAYLIGVLDRLDEEDRDDVP